MTYNQLEKLEKAMALYAAWYDAVGYGLRSIIVGLCEGFRSGFMLQFEEQGKTPEKRISHNTKILWEEVIQSPDPVRLGQMYGENLKRGVAQYRKNYA